MQGNADRDPRKATKATRSRDGASRELVVAVGASAGGLEAFGQFLEGLPRSPSFGIVFVGHLADEQGDSLVKVIRRKTSLRVELVKAGARPTAGIVHIVPPRTAVTLSGGRFATTPARATKGQPLNIDDFFRSLAADPSIFPVGIVLSGTMADGTDGLSAIRAAGGITIAQEPKTARFEAMPVNAIAAGQADTILMPQRMGKTLARIANAPFQAGAHGDSLATPREGGDATRILGLLRKSRGLDLTLYKPATIRRRLLRRMVIANRRTIASYTRLLQKKPSELDALAHDLLIKVTAFFREPTAFDVVRQIVLPKIVKDRNPQSPIRIWVPGCATGEEVYSLAILVREYLAEQQIERVVQIFGTDVSEEALARARQGIYTKAIESQVSSERLSRFFVRSGESYAVHSSIRELCTFATHNVLSDPPFSRMDLVSCRNVLIYLNAEGHRTAVNMFHFALNPGGYLLLGAAETLGSFESLFAPAGTGGHLYRRQDKPAKPMAGLHLRRFSSELVPPAPTAPFGTNIQRHSEQILIDRYSPPGVLVNDAFEIERFIGNTAQVLEHRAGQPSMNLLQLARGALSPQLSSLIARARKTGRPVVKSNVRISGDRSIRLRVVPVGRPQTTPEHFLILFEATGSSRKEATIGEAKQVRGTERENRRVRALERQLRDMRDFLRSALQQQEAINDQLTIASEELQSRNEELQSMNEELQTAKEELQSTNEELMSTNDQLHARNHEIMAMNTELTNLIAGADLPILMLDRDIRIRRFSPPAGSLMNIRPSDAGRPLTDLNVNFPLGDILRGFAECMADGQDKNVELPHNDGTKFKIRIVPFVGIGGRVEGAVLHFRSLL